YSLAASLYHCISGAAPAPADERAQKVSNGEEDPYAPIAGRFPGHDPRLLALIDRALARPLKDRPPDAAAWFAAIPDATTRIVGHVAAAAVAPVPAPAPTPSGGTFWKGAAVGGVSLALLGGGALALAPGVFAPSVFGGGVFGGETGTSGTEMRRQLDEAHETMTGLEAELAAMSDDAADLQLDADAATLARDQAQTRADELAETVINLRAQLREAGEGDPEQATILRNQLDQALTDQENALDVQRNLEMRVAELEVALEDARAAANTAPEVETLISARGEAEADRDVALARAEDLATEVAALEARIAVLGEASPEDAELEALLAERDTALAASSRAERDVTRAQADLQRMATNLTEAEEEAGRLTMELRAARAEVELMLASTTLPNPLPITPATSTGDCPTWAIAGPVQSYTGTDIYSPQALTLRAGTSRALSGCEGLPFNVAGFANQVPNLTLQLSEMARFRRLELQVTSECDTTLLVNTQDTLWHFDDNSSGGVLPLLNLTGQDAIEGRLDVWVGTIDGVSCDAELEIEAWLN
ncbi:MAG: hypothetical protein JKY00_08180, partial [Roseicyclus sp.]|nr:hypothetical protein [Roseicyclus sp.]